MIRPERIAHVVIKVRTLARSLPFYRDLLGMDVMGEIPGIVFLANGRRDHHEIALVEIGHDAEAQSPRAIGLVHIAFRLRDEATLRAAYQELKLNDVPISFTVNHGVTKSVYFFDPDGNELEVYCDNPPDEVRTFPNPYGGTEKLPFAANDSGLMDALARLQSA